MIEKKFALALDPVYIGTGGYQIGRVDNTIVREPATGVPKIPGTSIAGAIRAYAEMANKEEADNNKKVDINIVFGTIREEGGRQGMLRFYDAQIVFFPVNSREGTVWVTTRELIKYWFDENGDISLPLPNRVNEEKAFVLKGITESTSLNLGWLLLETQKIEKRKEVKLLKELDSRLSKIVMVSQKLFSHIINDNLEVRTSVRISPETGAAEDGGLFTYEAIPRGTIVGFEICCDERRGKDKKLTYESQIKPLLVNAYAYLKMLGIGGMGTRGFGRLHMLDGGGND